jgi:hypothetical protein
MTQQPDTIQRPRPCGEDEFFAHPDDPVDRLGRLFVALKLRERYGITFSRYVELVRLGTWKEVAG